MVADGRGGGGEGGGVGGGLGWGEAGNVSSPTIPAPNQTLIYQYFPTFQCYAQQVVVKLVISAGEFYVSGKKYI